MIKTKKGQFLLLSIAILIISMVVVFQYIDTSSETSSLLFQPSFSAEAANLFRAVKGSNTWLEEEWYNFSLYQVRMEVLEVNANPTVFNISVPCIDVVVTNTSDERTTTKNIFASGTKCNVKVSDMQVGDYINYYIYSDVVIDNRINITLGPKESPLYYRGSQLRSKLCDHTYTIYAEKQIQLECTVFT